MTIEKEMRDAAVKGGTGTSKIFGRQKGGAKITARNQIAAGVNEMTVATIKDAIEILNTANLSTCVNSSIFIFTSLHLHKPNSMNSSSCYNHRQSGSLFYRHSLIHIFLQY